MIKDNAAPPSHKIKDAIKQINIVWLENNKTRRPDLTLSYQSLQRLFKKSQFKYTHDNDNVS